LKRKKRYKTKHTENLIDVLTKNSRRKMRRRGRKKQEEEEEEEKDRKRNYKHEVEKENTDKS
jgi:hypothetical protein